eukprot:CAMPEP_0197833484 /NCGR_PEP_ID=MMETSP1437-20131217/19199_1 /TAXON_ID=49252 ORGANISM="Eucampia antarctica, Strain CCMP1452" /NCGR_SAMPLE_ID=MMETSP1437 /ASSEMBLY_ACC=CAM_ASM_001096 /LENGTH=227 /DNA_ID=CAMNT_0043437569 /DNA_START=25 /DNA_END=704 /DNA_ORIENTATION=-
MNKGLPKPARPNAEPLSVGTPTNVSEAAFEFLLTEILHWVEVECRSQQEKITAQKEKEEEVGIEKRSHHQPSKEEMAILAAERAAAKIERLGFDVGYRLCERLAQSKALAPSSAASQSAPPPKVTPEVHALSVMQLEAVKFLCKEFWTEVFRKQIDKLQTNHRGVFVLKDHELKWLRRLPSDNEIARVAAIKLLAFPCGLIRGALSNLGIAAVVSCDFLADGKNMAA